MIARFNLNQALRAILAIVMGCVATVVTLCFFSFGISYFVLTFGLNIFEPWIPSIVGVMMLAIFVYGWDLWRTGFGNQEFQESVFIDAFGATSGVSTLANLQTFEVRGYGYLFSQIALAAPLQFLKAFDLLRSRIKPSLGLETDLEHLLQKISSKGRWHPITDYQPQQKEVMYLVRMGLVDFSPRKGSLKAKT